MQGPDHYVRVPLGNKQLLLHGSIIHHVPEDAAIGAIEWAKLAVWQHARHGISCCMWLDCAGRGRVVILCYGCECVCVLFEGALFRLVQRTTTICVGPAMLISSV